MPYDHITTDEQLVRYCDEISTATAIAFDTEFISEHTYRSDLCLVQVAVEDRLVVIDSVTINNMQPFWELLVQPGHETLVHAGREELREVLWQVTARIVERSSATRPSTPGTLSVARTKREAA